MDLFTGSTAHVVRCMSLSQMLTSSRFFGLAQVVSFASHNYSPRNAAAFPKTPIRFE